MDYRDLPAMVPVNGRAASVVSQRGIESDKPLSREELIEIVARLERKSRLLKLVLHIKTKAQHKNLMWKTNKGHRTVRSAAEPRSVKEYKRVGLELQRMHAAIREINTAARAAKAEQVAEPAQPLAATN